MEQHRRTKVLIIMCSLCAMLCSCGYEISQEHSKQVNTSGGVGKDYLADNYYGLQDYISNNLLGMYYSHTFADLNEDGYKELFLYWTLDSKNWYTYLFSVDDKGVYMVKNEEIQKTVFLPVKKQNGEYRLAKETTDGKVEIYDFYFNKIGSEMTIELEDDLDSSDWKMPEVEKGYKFDLEGED